ncbi:FtsQ-type POTRA domain-containing protein [Chloroflexi bacterium CFX6]|nr:FtsQ-type POTRA domain-containing protein [Chloroflexi bacterium CFX6]
MNDRKEFTRAELVRLRREREREEQLRRASKVVTRSVPAAPRARRNDPQPVRKPSRAKGARRRFQIALPHAPRVAARAVSLPRPRLGWRLLSFAFAALLATALYLAFNRPELRVTQAQLTGNQMLSQAEVDAALNVSGQPIFLLTPSELETRLRLNYPELVSVRVTVSLPNLVSVHVTERQPVVRWEQGGGYTWIAEDGVAFRPRGEMGGLISVLALSAPPVEGIASSPDPLTPAPFISADMVQALKGLAKYVPPGATILYEKGNGFGWNDPRGWRVHFGSSARDIELKMRVYEALVNSLTQKGIRPALINVMYPSAPYYRLTQ